MIKKYQPPKANMTNEELGDYYKKLFQPGGFDSKNF